MVSPRLRRNPTDGVLFCSDGRWAIPANYDAVADFSDDAYIAAVKVGDKWGAINDVGKIVILPQYREEFTFSEGLAYVNDQGVNKYVDKLGQTVFTLAPVPNGLQRFGGAFSYGLAMISYSDSVSSYYSRRTEYVDRTGKVIFRLGNLSTCGPVDAYGIIKCDSNYDAKLFIRFDLSGKILARTEDDISLKIVNPPPWK